MSTNESPEMSFWDHLEVLRGTLFRSALSVMIIALVLFCLKDYFFDSVVLAPTKASFPTYRLFGIETNIDLVNYELSAQFMVHLRVSLLAALVLATPYILFELWKFIAPALYEREKRKIRFAFLFAGGLFYAGLVTGYFILLPFILNFFNGYVVSDLVKNTISLTSYMSSFFSSLFSMGVAFELPAVVLVLSELGLIDREFLKKYRKHALVVILIIAAFITPADLLSMFIVALPLYLLYEFSILICKKGENSENEPEV